MLRTIRGNLEYCATNIHLAYDVHDGDGMSITLKALKKYNQIPKVIIHSLDLSLYVCSVIIDNEEHYLVGKDGLPIKAFNKLEIQALFEKLNVQLIVLRQQSAYDEMVGQPPREADNTMEVPLGGSIYGIVTGALNATIH